MTHRSPHLSVTSQARVLVKANLSLSHTKVHLNCHVEHVGGF